MSNTAVNMPPQYFFGETDMDKKMQPEHLLEVLNSLTPERRVAVEKLAAELANNKDMTQAASMLEKSESLETAKLVGQLGWLTALSTAIAVIAE